MTSDRPPALTEHDVLAFLAEVRELGVDVIPNRPPILDGWTIYISTTTWIGISPSDRSKGMWTLVADRPGNRIADVGTMAELRDVVAGTLRMVGYTLRKLSVPALEKLRTVAGSRALVGIADEWFSPHALRNLHKYADAGGCLPRK